MKLQFIGVVFAGSVLLLGCQEGSPTGTGAGGRGTDTTSTPITSEPAETSTRPETEGPGQSTEVTRNEIAGDSKSPKSSATNEIAAEKDGVTLRLGGWDRVQELVKQHKGRVVVLDLWSTFCEPCVREFPHLVELHQQFGPDNVACLSASWDWDGAGDGPSPDDIDRTFAFLHETQAAFENVLLTDNPDSLYSMLDLAAIPAVYVYDQDGNLKKRFDNDHEDYGADGFTYTEHVRPLVEKLLAGQE